VSYVYFLQIERTNSKAEENNMRKLKLQMQITVDGFVAGANGELDWMTWNWDDELKAHVKAMTDSVDTILMGRKMTDGFISHWSSITDNPQDESYEFAKKMMDTEKVVFTKTLSESNWKNTRLAKGDLMKEISDLKDQPGNDIVAYGGAGFVSSLVKSNLIDEYHLFINPAAIGKGLTIFGTLDDGKKLRLVNSRAFDCGVILAFYKPAE